MRHPILLLATLILAITMVIPSTWGMNHMRPMKPYGGYCRGMQWGWYGASRAVNTANEARSHLEEHVKGTQFAVGEITEEETFYKADINDQDGNRVDILIVDKRTARIRSIY